MRPAAGGGAGRGPEPGPGRPGGPQRLPAPAGGGPGRPAGPARRPGAPGPRGGPRPEAGA